MKATLNLIHIKKAEDDMKKALITETNKIIKNSIADIDSELRVLTKTLMLKSKFFKELLSGDLAGHFGIEPGNIPQVIDALVDEISNSIEVSFTRLSISGNQVRGGVSIGIGKNNFAALINLPEASVVTDKNQTLDWLAWVMTKGDKVIISEHDIIFKLDSGRSGLAIMVPSKVASWRVPAEFSGTANDNFITREILRNVEVYSRLVSRLINKQIKSKL